MDGVEDYFTSGRIQELYTLLVSFLNNKNITTKIDGAPAIVMWSEFPGVDGPGISYKTIVSQLQKGNPQNVFTKVEQLKQLADQNSASDDPEGKKAQISKRLNAFQKALESIAPNVKPGFMLWGDVLFTDSTKQIKNGNVVCTPNTLTYEFDSKHFPDAAKADFGICIHTAVSKNFQAKSISDIQSYVSNVPSNTFILSLDDVKPELSHSTDLMRRLNEVNKRAQSLKSVLTPEVGKALRKATKKNLDFVETIKADRKNKNLTDEQINDIVNTYMSYIQLKEDIVKECKVDKIKTTFDGKAHSGEGYVVNDGKNIMKLVSTEDFTKHNIEHMNKAKQIHENVEGKMFKIWSSSKDSNLFKYYIKKELEFGHGGGSMYGFAVYGVVEPPFSKDAKIGYSTEVRAKIYGENIFEFEIPCNEVFFLQFDIYKKTPQGKSAKFETFIADQLKAFKIKLSDKDLEWITPTDPNADTAQQAFRLFKLFSRTGYQRKDGTIQSAFAGFVYKGKLDGLTYVGWDPYKLTPVRSSNDAGATWKEIDKNDKDYKAYVAGRSVADDGKEEYNRIFDGKFTKKKDIAYRLLMAHNSNDGTTAEGKELSMSEGIFYGITIHDDNTIDAKYKFNRPITDNYIHYFRPRKNIFLDKLFELGFKFGKLEGCGIKLGSESDKTAWTPYTVDEKYLPEEADGGIELIGTTIDKPIDLPCKTAKKLVLIKCEILADVFDEWKEVVLTDNEKKLNWTTHELKAKLAKKYKWANTDKLLDAKPEPPAKGKRGKKKAQKESEDQQNTEKNMKLKEATLDRNTILAIHKVPEAAIRRFVLKWWGPSTGTDMSDAIYIQAICYHPPSGCVFIKVMDSGNDRSMYCIADFDAAKRRFIPANNPEYQCNDLMTPSEAKTEFKKILDMKGNSPNNVGSDSMQLWVIWGGLER